MGILNSERSNGAQGRGIPPKLTGDPRVDRALLAVARVLAEIANKPSDSETYQDNVAQTTRVEGLTARK